MHSLPNSQPRWRGAQRPRHRQASAARRRRVRLDAIVGWFPSSKQSQFKGLEEAIHVLKAYVTKPLALCFNGGKNVFCLVGSLIEGFFDFVSRFARAGDAVELQKVVDEKAVK